MPKKGGFLDGLLKAGCIIDGDTIRRPNERRTSPVPVNGKNHA